jgi:hypothetical protein
MPTNKLWIEHTERAAWDTVSALRQEVAKLQKQVERMAPPTKGWEELLRALDAVKERHGLGGSTYAEILRSALDKIELAESRLRRDEKSR